MKRTRVYKTIFLFVIVAVALTALPVSSLHAGSTKTDQGLQQIFQYISKSWNTLTRSMTECRTFIDPKTNAKSTLYLPADFAAPSDLKATESSCNLEVKHLPTVIKKLGDIDVNAIHPPGLLYLPKPYVVPGGMFNGMYGWDSYFIIRGLIEDGRLNLARNIVDNFFFEINHYGGVLNANRTYYLTRSQPPFLTSMIRDVYEVEKAKGEANRAWLKMAYGQAVKNYDFWTEPPHLAGSTGLSRYYGLGNGPVPELGAEADAYYRNVARYFLLHPEGSEPYLVQVQPGKKNPEAIGPEFSLILKLGGGHRHGKKKSEAIETFSLTRAFYKGDRSMRESGFDVSFRFGPFGASTPDFAAVGLNCLLYKSEKDLEWMSNILGLEQAAAKWRQRAVVRHEEINRYLWNPSLGMYYDYDFKNGVQSRYTYATTFYPLWVGVASPEQAKEVVSNLSAFDRPGGIEMSMDDTGAQWDAPYGWAPVELIAIEGLRRYGYDADANGISLQFLSMVLDSFRKDGTIHEKYDVATRSAQTHIEVGYKTNVVGFGWTNGVFLALYHEMSKAAQTRLAQE